MWAFGPGLLTPVPSCVSPITVLDSTCPPSEHPQCDLRKGGGEKDALQDGLLPEPSRITRAFLAWRPEGSPGVWGFGIGWVEKKLRQED